MTARLYFKTLLSVIAVLAVAMVAVDYFGTRVVRSSHEKNLGKDLAERAGMIAVLLERGMDDATIERVRSMAAVSRARLTVTGPDGTVLFDTEAEARTMENHAARAEFREALAGRDGSSVRRSTTTGVDYLYVAIPFRNGALRLAVPLVEVREQVESIRRQMLGSTAIAFIPALLIAAILARRTAQRLGRIIAYAGELARGNFRARLTQDYGGELGILSRQLNEAGEHLQHAVEQLEREHTELEKLERVRKDFVINVSHELRTPLASIQGYAETLIDGAIEDEVNRLRFLHIIRQNAERLASLTADLLTLSRIELKRQDLHFANHEFADIVTGAIDTVRPVADKKRVRLAERYEVETAFIHCDAEAVHQILINLLDNAIKYTPEGGTITVGARPAAGPGGATMLEIYVKDSGIGIPAEDLPRLFERFYRVDKARSRELGGTGLGLAIVKHLVLAQGGQVRVESAINEGSTFFFTLSSTFTTP
ncbi:MAG: HAMP domain-containing protein [Bryobacterales bacterium]|nr:HAMP domain-containing protein [Bryobacterales bacterium]